jgi:hypothetical protein
MSSFIITLLLHLIYFIVVFVCRAFGLSTTQEMVRAWSVWLEDGAAQQAAPKETEVKATQHEAPEEPNVEDEADDLP